MNIAWRVMRRDRPQMRSCMNLRSRGRMRGCAGVGVSMCLIEPHGVADAPWRRVRAEGPETRDDVDRRLRWNWCRHILIRMWPYLYFTLRQRCRPFTPSSRHGAAGGNALMARHLTVWTPDRLRQFGVGTPPGRSGGCDVLKVTDGGDAA
jgi:hypothetical protein